MHTATVRLAAPDAAACEAVRRALQVEAADGPAGTTTVLRCEGRQLVAEVAGEDLPGLRAALTTAVRLAGAALQLPSEAAVHTHPSLKSGRGNHASMRTPVALLVLALLCSALSGCASTSEPTTSTSASNTSSATTSGTAQANRAPTATLQANRTFGAAPLPVTFSLGGTDPDGDRLNWTLSLGNATRTGTSLPATVNHTFAAGNATVVLTVSDGRAQANATVTIAAAQGVREAVPPPVTFTGTATGACYVADCSAPDILHAFTVTSAVTKVTALLAWDFPAPGTDLDLYVADAAGEDRGSSACNNTGPDTNPEIPGVGTPFSCARGSDEEVLVEDVTPDDAGTWEARIVQYLAPEIDYTLTITFA